MVLTTGMTAADPIYQTLFQPTYVVTNDLAAYTAPVVLIACNLRVRALLLDTAQKPFTWVGCFRHSNEIQPSTIVL
ncbi:hypothetical protein PMAYCL1PPCAC_09091 [Pristionchus mayeri]|uniref:G protein-coupled receptor n=1 Tax=Pristionchus mayeri TaxID=1317129 RepID=A0AAN4ZDQ8_9BILA|nr:hypothetical protein PMAYCL1PPCAC_09091 [Pristionchus mayeri]